MGKMKTDKGRVIDDAFRLEAVRLLLDDNQIDIAFVQGGITRRGAGTGTLRTLASLAIEPLWGFSQSEQFDHLETSQGVRVAAGRTGSGKRTASEVLAPATGNYRPVAIDQESSPSRWSRAYTPHVNRCRKPHVTRSEQTANGG